MSNLPMAGAYCGFASNRAFGKDECWRQCRLQHFYMAVLNMALAGFRSRRVADVMVDMVLVAARSEGLGARECTKA